MFDRLKAWLGDDQGVLSGGEDELELAVAALLVEAAQIDADFDAGERTVIGGLLERRFGLAPDAAVRLLASGERQAAGSAQLFGFVRVVNERLSAAKRIELIEMLWEVAYADGVLDPLEDVLLRRLGGLIDVSDHERGAARLRVLARLGIGDTN
jgi:uncharacterized tellurite resistance protein B-like protein